MLRSHTRTVPSRDPESTWGCSGWQSTATTASAWASTLRQCGMRWCCCQFVPPEAAAAEKEEEAGCCSTLVSCICRVSHTRTVPSNEPETISPTHLQKVEHTQKNFDRMVKFTAFTCILVVLHTEHVSFMPNKRPYAAPSLHIPHLNCLIIRTGNNILITKGPYTIVYAIIVIKLWTICTNCSL